MKTHGEKEKKPDPCGIRTHDFWNRSTSVALATNLTTSPAWELYKHRKISTGKILKSQPGITIKIVKNHFTLAKKTLKTNVKITGRFDQKS